MVTFKGYLRPDGQVGIRNHVVAIANASCGCGVVDRIAQQVPGLIPLPHTYGCSAPGEHERWRKILVNAMSNPNIYGVVLIGVGCEDQDARDMAELIRKKSGKPVFVNIVRYDGGGQKVIENGVEAAKSLLEEAKKCKRVDVPISKLIFGTECGGSDALSGITANPAIGYVSDWVIKNGGTALLSETAELIGTEKILADRAVSKEVADKVYNMIYTEEERLRGLMGSDCARALAKGNIEGGLTTIQEKSMGCAKKGGTTPVVDVIDYADSVGDKKGLIIMDGVGYDPTSVTGLAACGAQVVMYSTGRGNPLAHPFVPVIKVCSNSQTYEAVGGIDGDMDINAGAIITEGLSPEKLGEYCVNYLLNTLNGEETRPEKLGYGGAFHVYYPTGTL